MGGQIDEMHNVMKSDEAVPQLSHRMRSTFSEKADITALHQQLHEQAAMLRDQGVQLNGQEKSIAALQRDLHRTQQPSFERSTGSKLVERTLAAGDKFAERVGVMIELINSLPPSLGKWQEEIAKGPGLVKEVNKLIPKKMRGMPEYEDELATATAEQAALKKLGKQYSKELTRTLASVNDAVNSFEAASKSATKYHRNGDQPNFTDSVVQMEKALDEMRMAEGLATMLQASYKSWLPEDGE